MSTIKFELNDKNEIISYVKQGGIVGIDLTDFDASKLPDDFFDNYRSGYYMLQNDKVVENPNYIAPLPSVSTGPSDVQNIVMQQAKIIAQMQSALMQQSKDIAKLKGANA